MKIEEYGNFFTSNIDFPIPLGIKKNRNFLTHLKHLHVNFTEITLTLKKDLPQTNFSTTMLPVGQNHKRKIFFLLI